MLSRHKPQKKEVLASVFFLLILVLAWFLYSPGMGSSLHFDDPHNLGGLSQVHDFQSATTFILSGTAGPLGRPISLTSFALQAYAWPSATETFLQTNILIHLLNGALVSWLLFLVGSNQRRPPGQAALIAVVAGTIWLLTPILASSSLIIVQRMTTISALFVLLGLIGYLYSRRDIEERPVAAIFGMSLSIVAGSTLAVFSKENGTLLPLFALVLETTLLPRPTRLPNHLWRSWFTVALLLPAITITLYLITRVPYGESVVLQRHFTSLERLFTEAQILWEYLYRAFLPNPGHFAPFHDDYPVRGPQSLFALISVVAWAGTITAAVTLRRRLPVFTFAVAWYLAGHSLESTTIPLELYFEHRNYIPLIGPIYALAYMALTVPSEWIKLSYLSLTAYILLLGATLFSLTSLWGNPWLAAEMWHIYKENSVRAAQYLAGQLQANGDYRTSRRVLVNTLEKHSEEQNLQLQILQLDCVISPDKDHSERTRKLKKAFIDARFRIGVQETLAALYRQTTQKPCNGITPETIYSLAAVLAENPSFQSHHIVHHNLHVLMAEISVHKRNLDATMHHLEKALEIYANPNTLTLAVGTLNSAGLHNDASSFIKQALTWKPRNTLRAKMWQKQIQQLRSIQDKIYPSSPNDNDTQHTDQHQ